MDSRVQNQIRDLGIIYRALTQYYREGNVSVFSSFNSLPVGETVPDYARITFKQESSDTREEGGNRFALRLLVSMPDMSRLIAQKTVYPDSQATFLISPSNKGTYCAMLFYVHTAEGDRKLCCPYAAGLSLQLMSTDISQLICREERVAENTLTHEVFPFLPLHRAGFYKSDQQQLHGFLIMREVCESAESEIREAVYWRTHGLNSAVQLSRDYREAMCCRYSPACVDVPRGQSPITIPVRHSQSVRGERMEKSPLLRNHSIYHGDTDLYSVFIRDTSLVWSALYRYMTGPEAHTSQQSFTAFLASNTLLPYCPQTGAPPSDLQVPMEMRRSLRARTHNEIRDGYPTSVFVNPETMLLVSNSQVPLYQATYFLEFQDTKQVAMLFYVCKSARERYLAVSSQSEDSETQLLTKLSDNLGPHIDRQHTEVAVGLLKDRILPNLLPKLDMKNWVLDLGGTHQQFYLYKKSPHRYHYWKVNPDNMTVLTVDSTEASVFQLIEKSS